MTKTKWKNRIVKAMKDVGTYQPSFDDVIETLAGMLERRDAIEKELAGAPTMIEHTNKAGATNITQNPLIRLWNDLNRDVLTYWRDLGLTPKGLKAIKDSALNKENKSAFLFDIDQLEG